MYYHTKFRCCRSNRLGVIMEIRQKIFTPRFPLFKVTQGHWNRHRSIYEFILVFDSLYGPVSYRFRDKRRFLSKIAILSSPRAFNAPLMKFPLELVTAIALNNLESCPYPMVGRVWRYMHSFQYSTRVRRRDGRICHNTIALCVHRRADER